MHVLFADSVDESGLAQLRASGHSVAVDPALSVEDLEHQLKGVDVLVVRSTKVSRTAIENADTLSLIVRAGAGVDNIDTQAAADWGVYVCNVPGRNSVAVAELTMGLLLAIDRRIVDNTADLRNSVWNKKLYAKADGIMGKTLGIIGLGAIGLAVAERAHAFGMQVITQDRPNRSAQTLQEMQRLGITSVPTQEALLAAADVVSLHVPNTEETKGMVDAAFLAQMRPGAILLNTSCGSSMNGPDLLHALETTDLRAGLDVFPDEPGSGESTFASALAAHPQVVGTHHIGASTAQAQRATVAGTVDTIVSYATGILQNCVNMETQPRGSATLLIRHEDKVGVLAQVLQTLKAESINVQEMDNSVFRGGTAAVAKIDVVPLPSADAIASISEIPEVFGVQCNERV